MPAGADAPRLPIKVAFAAIGAGYSGLSVARIAAKCVLRVVVLEGRDDRLAGQFVHRRHGARCPGLARRVS